MMTENVQVQYPVLRVLAHPELVDSTENAKIEQILYRVYEQFDDICRFQEVTHDVSFKVKRSLIVAVV